MADLNIRDLDYGWSQSGVIQYIADLKLYMFDNVRKKIEEGEKNVILALDKGWSGIAREKFDQLFKAKCEELINAINEEYIDLKSRIVDLTYNYAEQDAEMIKD